MTRGRRPLPTAVKERRGSFRVNPERRNKAEPQPPKDAPPPPAVVKSDDVAADQWRQLCRDLDTLGVLAVTDRQLMIQYVTTYSQWLRAYKYVRDHGVRHTSHTGNVITSPETHHYHKLADRIVRLLVEMGLTPAARSKLTANNNEPEESPMTTLINRLAGNN